MFTRAEMKQQKCVETLLVGNKFCKFGRQGQGLASLYWQTDESPTKQHGSRGKVYEFYSRGDQLISLGASSILTETSHAFPQSGEANTGIASQIMLLLPHSFYFITH